MVVLGATFDDCARGAVTVRFTGRTIGDLLSAAGVSWGWFEAGFAPTSVTGGRAACAARHTSLTGVTSRDYTGDRFEYYQSTSNPAPPAAQLAGPRRPPRPGQPPVRPERLLDRRRRRPARGVVPARRVVPAGPPGII